MSSVYTEWLFCWFLSGIPFRSRPVAWTRTPSFLQHQYVYQVQLRTRSILRWSLRQGFSSWLQMPKLQQLLIIRKVRKGINKGQKHGVRWLVGHMELPLGKFMCTPMITTWFLKSHCNINAVHQYLLNRFLTDVVWWISCDRLFWHRFQLLQLLTYRPLVLSTRLGVTILTIFLVLKEWTVMPRSFASCKNHLCLLYGKAFLGSPLVELRFYTVRTTSWHERY